MHSIKKAQRKYNKLVHYIAHKYSRRGHYLLSQEELASEGMLVLVRCCRDLPTGITKFDRYFKQSLYNQIKSLHRFATEQKRSGYELSLENALGICEIQSKSAYEERAVQLFPSLNGRAKLLLETLVFPPLGLHDYAYARFLRKPTKTFRIKRADIHGYLGMSSYQVKKAIQEIREVVVRGNSSQSKRRK